MARYRTFIYNNPYNDQKDYIKKKKNIEILKSSKCNNTEKEPCEFNGISYKSRIELLKIFPHFDNNCLKRCDGIPLIISPVLTSEINYKEFKDKTKNIGDYNKCLFPYGKFINDNNPNINYSLKRKLIFKCDKKEICPLTFAVG